MQTKTKYPLEKDLKRLEAAFGSVKTSPFKRDHKDRVFPEERLKRLKMLRKLDGLTKNSEFTENDAIGFGRKINKGITLRHEL